MTMAEELHSSGCTVDIPVWIHGSEKLVTGIGKTTTCDDIIYSLLVNHGVKHAEIESLNYVICERWHKVERPLSGRAKLAKVWKAWGPDRHNVKFTIKHVQVPGVYKVRRRRRKSQDEFFDPEKMRAEKSRLQTIEDLVQVVGEQQRRLKEQVTRITETDREIEHFETDVHLNRMRVRGRDYVQDSLFLSHSDDSSGMEEMNVALSASDFEVYLELCDKVLDLDQRISVHRQESERLEHSLTAQPESFYDGDDSELLREACEIKQRIHCFESDNERIDRELYRIKTQITDRDIMIRRKQDLVERLVEEVNEMEEKSGFSSGSSPDSGKAKSPEVKKQVTFQLPGEKMNSVTAFSFTNGLCAGTIGKTNGLNGILKFQDSDSNSDTGLSSLHSDEAQPMVLETLV